MKKMLLFGTFLGALLSASSFAEIYDCYSAQFEAYLVFDDGPGGLDSAEVTYLGENYTLRDISDQKTADDRYEYGLHTLAFLLKSPALSFTLDARRLRPDENRFLGSLSITKGRSKEVFELVCDQQ
jgi:hypothetical protein